MKNTHISSKNRSRRAFTLMETVIAIGVLVVLLTGFLAVFTPATLGIRRSISSQQANRLTTTLERELVTIRTGQSPTTAKTGFDKAFDWIQKSNTAASAILVYQYRGDTSTLRSDGSPQPLDNISGQPGTDYIIQSIARRVDDTLLLEDLKAIDGAIFYVKTKQLVYSGNEMILGKEGEIRNPNKIDDPVIETPDTYPAAVIAFSADF
jgi:type II secretory pathway pseudopilin PulG